MIRNLGALFVVLALGACSSMKVAEVDSKSGYFPGSTKATVLTNKAVDLDSRKALLLIPNGDFIKGQMANIKYFGEIITFDDLEKRIVQGNLGDKVPSVRDRIGISNAAKYYKSFLWFRIERLGEGTNQRARFILTDPLTQEDYFVAETKLDFIWTGVNDQNNWYPMFNSLIDYVRQNSKTYQK